MASVSWRLSPWLQSRRLPQAVLLVNTDETLLSPAQYKQIYNVLATAYRRGLTS